MAKSTVNSLERKSRLHEISRFLFPVLLILIFMVFGSIACKEKAVEEDVSTEEEGVIKFEGKVKVAVGKFMYVPELSGFDLVVPDDLDTSTLVGETVRGEGEFTPERPAILIVNSLEVQNEDGSWQNIFTRLKKDESEKGKAVEAGEESELSEEGEVLKEEVQLENYLDVKTREAFPVFEELSYDKKDIWEGMEQVKVYGKLEEISKEGEEPSYRILVLDEEEEKEIGYILVEEISDFAEFYIKKLRLYDKFWFYLNIKETVDWSVRRRTKEMFHADIIFAGLF